VNQNVNQLTRPAKAIEAAKKAGVVLSKLRFACIAFVILLDLQAARTEIVNPGPL
jgi:hypothetical protein